MNLHSTTDFTLMFGKCRNEEVFPQVETVECDLRYQENYIIALEVVEDFIWADFRSSGHFKWFRSTSAFTQSGSFDKTHAWINSDCLQSWHVWRTENPFVIVQVVNLSHGDYGCFDRRQEGVNVSEKLSDRQSVSLRDCESLPWKQPSNETCIEIQRTSFYFSSQWIRSIKYNQLFAGFG
jgi:hypothetical protein